MKEFEKWSKTPNGYAERGSDYAEGGAAWRAALEWVLRKENEYVFIWRQEHTGKTYDVYDMIREELEDD